MRLMIRATLALALALLPLTGHAQAPAQPPAAAATTTAAPPLETSRLIALGLGVAAGLVIYNVVTRGLAPVPPAAAAELSQGIYIGPVPTAATFRPPYSPWRGVAPALSGAAGAVLANWLYGRS